MKFFEIENIKKQNEDAIKKRAFDLLKQTASEQKLQNKTDELNAALQYIEKLLEWQVDKNKNAKKELIKMIKNKTELVSILYICKDIENIFFFNDDTKTWYKYNLFYPYVWSPIDELKFKKELEENLKELLPYELFVEITENILDSLTQALARRLFINLSEKTNKEHCVFGDQPYNIETFKKIENCGPQHYITTYTSLPWDPQKEAEKKWNENKIKQWLDQRMPNNEKIELFRAICNVIFHSNLKYNLEFFVELYGPRSSGKSSLVRLMETLISRSLICASTLQSLEQNDFERAKIAGKHLILLNEQTSYIGDSKFLMKATGGDLIPINPKYKDPYEIRNYGIFIVTGNDPLVFNAGATAIMRRRLTIYFDKTINTSEANTNLIYFDNKGVSPQCEFYPHLVGFLHWVLTLPANQTKKIIQKELAKASINPDKYSVVWWITNNLAPFDKAKIGVTSNTYGPALYEQYRLLCQKNGTKPVSVQNFIAHVTRDFKTAFNYPINILHENNEIILEGLTYQIELRDHFENFRAAYKKEYGDIFFGENTTFFYTDKHIYFLSQKFNENEIDKSIHILTNQIDNLIREAPKGMYSLIGNPTRTAGHFDVKYNQKFIPGGVLPKNESDFYLTLTKKKHKEIFFNFINNSFEMDKENNAITSQDLYNLYVSYMHKNKYQPLLTSNQIKTHIRKTWNEHFAHKIENINNIGPKALKGLVGLKIKKSAE